MPRLNLAPLHVLASQYGIQNSYYDVHRRRRHAAPEGLLALIRALGAPVDTPRDVPNALRARRQELCHQAVEPVVVAWAGQPAVVELQLPDHQANGSIVCHLQRETGETQRWTGKLAQLTAIKKERVEGVRYVTKRLVLPRALPRGYHRLTIETGRRRAESLLIASPVSAYSRAEGSAHKAWGLFVPLYALHSQRSWGAGDYSDLEALTQRVAELGGRRRRDAPTVGGFFGDAL